MNVSLPFIVLSTLALGSSFLAVGCADDREVRGQIVGVAGKKTLAKTGPINLDRLAFAGQLEVKLPNGETVMAECREEIVFGRLHVKLSNGETVMAECREEVVSKLRGAPEFHDERPRKGYVVTVVVSLDEGQEALLVRDESGAWVVKYITLDLPTMVDKGTRMDSVTYERGRFQYDLTIVDATIDEVDVDVFSDLWRLVTAKGLCGNPVLKAGLEDGETYAYAHFDMNGTLITEIVIDIKDCE